MNYIDRFWSKVILSDDPDACWGWTDKTPSLGIGGKVYSVGRASWFVHNDGVIEEWLLVLHHCDNAWCGNVKHLYLGTDKDNVRDAIVRKRAKNLSNRVHWKHKRV